jgi:hypothetical protein
MRLMIYDHQEGPEEDAGGIEWNTSHYSRNIKRSHYYIECY